MQPILTINLTNREIGSFTIPRDWEKEYLGGASLAARYLIDYLKPELKPLAPESPLLFLNGPLSGTAGPAVGRYVICGRSPATNLWSESNCGGFWGVELRKTGFDGLLVTGKSETPVYMWIHDSTVEFMPADHLWGKETYPTQQAIMAERELPGVRVACIGPAGEAEIPFALILSDHGRVAGRTGLGAVMGSKNLKAIAVKGSGPVPVENREEYYKLRSTINRELRNDPVSKIARDLGTASVVDYFDYLLEMPKRYFTLGQSHGNLNISGVNIKHTIQSGISACHGCVIACGRIVKLGDGLRRKGAEYETLVGFGPNLMIDDTRRITIFGEICDRYGMDTISLSNIIGLAIRMYELGIIDLNDTDGLKLDWGDADVVEELIHKTARKEGLGIYLALGARDFARQFGAEEEAVQVNGLEAAYHDPRGATGMALSYATSPRGACHNQSDYFLVEVGQIYQSLGMMYFSPRAGAEKVINVVRHQDWRTLFNSLVMCLFANLPPEMVLDLINYAVDLDYSLEDMMRTGERGWTIKRVINNHLGLIRRNDVLPKAFLVPYEDEPDGFVPDFNGMLEAYYNTRMWDLKTGFPQVKKMVELNLDWALDYLPKIKKKANRVS
jgi:aldehyde:ferredoxin oxidoreductase